MVSLAPASSGPRSAATMRRHVLAFLADFQVSTRSSSTSLVATIPLLSQGATSWPSGVVAGVPVAVVTSGGPEVEVAPPVVVVVLGVADVSSSSPLQLPRATAAARTAPAKRPVVRSLRTDITAGRYRGRGP